MLQPDHAAEQRLLSWVARLMEKPRTPRKS